ncbi:MAG: T9SS type A sorting domain-containing protein [Flavobacteriales bacterium]|nr:T9SS type A sorting domain-containing protein [Flavobacteriales bacterium]
MKYFTRIYAAAFCLLLAINTNAQISHGGTPYQWETKSELAYETFRLPAIDLEARAVEDAINDLQKDLPYRFGENISVDIDIHTNGVWTELENGDGVWRIELYAKEAVSINFVFDSYRIPDGAQVFVYEPTKSQLLGSFTNENTSKENSLGVGLVFGDRAIIEYREPADVRGEGYLHINNVTHGYRDILGFNEEKGPFGNSGPCNINVNCPEGDPYDIQKRSVALIVSGFGNSVCTGSLINNTLQDETPYFLTANHCLGGNINNWVFYFNHQSPGCSGSSGPTNQSVSGSTLLASNVESDFALLELNSSPPESYNAVYAGYDATDDQNTVTSAIGIHHPGGDVKKICFENDAPFFQNIGSFVNQVWFISQWEAGVTEGGSSGSPLYNQNGLIIGQLGGGQAACSGSQNNGLYDFYGRMGVSWNFGGTPSNSLSFWLDPTNTGTLIVPPFSGEELSENNASLGMINGVPEDVCDLTVFTPSVGIVNVGSNIITSVSLEVTFNGSSQEVEWSGTIESFSSVFINLPEFSSVSGSNILTVEVLEVNGQSDDEELGNVSSREFLGYDTALEFTVNIDLDDYPTETTWVITDQLNQTIKSGGPYSAADDPVSVGVCLPADQCFDFTILDEAGDGLCCGFGLGSYEVLDNNGNVVASGGEFEISETSEICTILDTQDIQRDNLLIYPNPASDALEIRTRGEHLVEISVFDLSGKKIVQKSLVNASSTRFDTAALPSGVYVFEVTTSSGRKSRNKVVIARAK